MGNGLDNRYVIFRIGAEEYGLPVTVVNSIIRYEQATPVPRAPQGVLGVINLRGRVIPVVDLRLRFSGTPFAPTPGSRIVVAEGEAGPVGLAVDSASEVAELPAEQVRPVPEGVLSFETQRAFTGVVERADSLVILVDLDQAVPRSGYAGALANDEEGSDDV